MSINHNYETTVETSSGPSFESDGDLERIRDEFYEKQSLDDSESHAGSQSVEEWEEKVSAARGDVDAALSGQDEESEPSIAYELEPFDEVVRSAPNSEIGRRRFLALDLIRKREAEHIADNATVAERHIESNYLDNIVGATGKIHRTLKRRALRKKAAKFAKYFNETFFSDIEHSTKVDLGDTVEFHSSVERERLTGTAGSQTGSGDVALGNDMYVFANARQLKSPAGIQRNVYKINSEDGYVVPMDIAYTSVPWHEDHRHVDGYDYESENMELYAANIYSIQDFKKVFALYTASLFESPDEAISFFQMYRRSIGQNNWERAGDDKGFIPERTGGKSNNLLAHDSLGNTMHQPNEKAIRIAKNMKTLADKGVYPPAEPEFQFPHRIAARKVRVESAQRLF